MVIHQVECDKCGNIADLKYNGEHWLTPKGWVQLYDDNEAKMLDRHLCVDCNPCEDKPAKPKTK